MTTPSTPPPPEPKALPLPLDLPAEAPAVAAPPAPVRREGGRARTGTWAVVVRVVVALVLLVVVAAGAAAVLLPRYVRQQFIDAAAAHGITLAIDDARIEPGGFRLVGLRATAADLPGAAATAPQIDVELSGLRPSRMVVRGGELTLKGPWAQVDAAIARWRASPQGGQGGDWVPAELVIDESRLQWDQALGDAGRIDAANVHVDVTWKGGAQSLTAQSDKVGLTLAAGRLGPWRVDLERSPGTTRTRIALDPAVPEACTVLLVGDDQRTTHVDVAIPRSPPARLGLPMQGLGVRGKDLQVEATLHYADLGGAHASLTGTGAVHAMEGGALPRPLEVSWEITATGDPRQGLDVKKSRLAAGPLVGPLTGTVKAFDDGFRVDLAWSAGPVPCAAFDTPLDESQPFDIAYQLRKLADAAGLTKLAGEVSARGTAALDTRDLAVSHVEFSPQASCQVALFGH